MKNIIKIVLLGLVFFSILVYITAPDAPVKINKISILSLENLPNNVVLVGDTKINKNSLYKKDLTNLLIIGNHDSLSILSQFDKYYKTSLNITLVANISKAPWFIKKWVIPSKLEELTNDSDIRIIYDEDGSFIQSLNINKSDKTEFLVFEIKKNKDIVLLFKSRVKEDAINGSMSDQEIKTVLKPIYLLN